VFRQPIHLFEPTGFGGIFQHTCDLAGLLSSGGYDVTLHTAAQHETISLPDVHICKCVWWPPRDRYGVLRGPLIALRLSAGTLTHLVRSIPTRAVVHVEGGIASGPLTVLTLAAARRRGRAVVYSPHNTFSRRGPLDALVLAACLFFSEGAVAYSQLDVATLRSRGARATLSPLIQLVPEPAPERVARWRAAWGAGPEDQVVLFGGLIRRDKRPDLLVRAARGWPQSRKLAMVGQDRGELVRCRALARELGVELHAHDEFVPLDEFTAALSAADVVVAPHERASQSGVLSVAGQLGTATIAAHVGGLSELADRTFDSGDPGALARVIEEELAAPARGRRTLDTAAALAAHEDAYRDARATRAAARRRRHGRPPFAFVVWGPVAGRAEEFASALGGEYRAFFDLGIVDRRWIPLRYGLSALRTVGYLAAARPRSLIVANPPIFAAVIGWLYTRLAGVPLVLDSHPISFGQKSSRLGRFFLPVHAALARRATTTIVGTDELARRVRAWGGRADVVHEAPPLTRAAPGRRTSAHERPRVLWTGIFASDEPFPAVVDAARMCPEVDFLVAGDIRRCPVDPRLAPENVTWLGFLRGEDYGAALDGADVILALTDDGTSAMRAAAEAVYAGKPLVTSDLPHLNALFPEAVHVRNEAGAIAAGVRAALSEPERLVSRAPRTRERQVERWKAQRRLLLRRLGLDELESTDGEIAGRLAA
jgi:glycosyltransferase involved in cell wall biosynthesis